MIGQILNDRYRLDAELGRGGLGIIYSAYDELLDRAVAVKILTDPGLGTEGRGRLIDEARAAARLNHPNIVTVFDAGEAHLLDERSSSRGSQIPLTFIIMELVEGESLHTHRPQTIEETCAIARQVCAALEHAHAHKIVHRDLKPENVLITPQGLVKLTDFGLARSIASRISKEGMIVGTMFYLPPEQALGQAIDGRTDLYALGVMLYELAARRLPFTSDEPLAVISQHLYAPVVPPSTYNPEIPPALDALILKLMSKRMEDRPASAADVIRVLDGLTREQTGPRDKSTPQTELSSLDQLARGRLVGREPEFSEAKSLWKQVLSGSITENVLLISGESGVGKTPLLQEITALAEVSGAKVLLSDCYPEGSAPYAPIAQVIRSSLSVLGGGGIDAGTTQGGSSLSLPEPVLADLMAIAPDLLAYYPQAAPRASLDPAAEQQRLFESVVALCAALCSHTALLLCVEDVQWADAGTLSLLRHIARRSRSARLRLFTVLTYRDEELEETHPLNQVILDLNRERLAYRIKLARYNRDQTRELLITMLQQEISPDFLETIYRETEGNQFFIEEICKALIEQGRLYRESGQWRWTGMEDIQLPQSVRMVIQSRVEKLPTTAQEILRLAAIIGREFDFDTLCLASDMEEETLVSALEAAEQAQLINEVKSKSPGTGGSGVIKFAFAHGLILASLREAVSGLRRQRLHRRVAAAIENHYPEGNYPFDALAYHYQHAGEAERAQTYYAQAGDHALKVYANQEAERYYRKGLELKVSNQVQAQLFSGLGESLFRQSAYQQAGQSWEQAIHIYREINESDQVARLYARSARAAWHTGDPPRGMELCRMGLATIKSMAGLRDEAEIQELVDQPKLITPGMAALLHETARACRFNNLPEQALTLCQQAMAMARQLGLMEVQAEALATLGILPNRSPEERRQTLLQAVQLAEAANLPASAARAHLNLGVHLQDAGEFREARDHYLNARDLAQRAGSPSWEFGFLTDAVETSLEMGDFSTVAEGLSEMENLVNSLPVPQVGALIRSAFEACLLRYRGEILQATRQMQECLAGLRQQGERRYRVLVILCLADAFIEMGRLNEAEQVLAEAIQLCPKELAAESVLPYCQLSEAYASEGRVDEARRALTEARLQSLSRKVCFNEYRITRAQALLARVERRWPEAQAAYDKIIEQSTKMGLLWHTARSLHEAAEMHMARRLSQDGNLAAERLHQAKEIFQQLNILYYIRQVEEKLQSLEGLFPS